MGDDELGLELSAGDIAPWIMTWQEFSDLVQLVRYCCLDKRVFYAFKANVWIEDVFREIIDVQIWEPAEGVGGDIEIV